MKRTILAFLIFSAPVVAMEKDPLDSCYEQNKKLTELLTLTDEQCKKLFGYNPQLELVPETDVNIANSEQITIVPHGFGDSKEGVKALKKMASCYIPGTLIVYNCPEVNALGTDIVQANFGQLLDMKPALYALEQCHKLGVQRIHWRGFSRAGAITINCIAALSDYEKYHKEFELLGITPANARGILSMVQQGFIVLECPLTDITNVIENKLSPSSGKGWFSSVTKISATSVNTMMSISTQYNPGAEQGILSAKLLEEKQIPLNILIHTEQHDTLVPRNQEFENCFKKTNPEHTHITSGSGAHTQRSSEFYNILQLLNKKYNAAYDRNMLLEYCKKFQNSQN